MKPNRLKHHERDLRLLQKMPLLHHQIVKDPLDSSSNPERLALPPKEPCVLKEISCPVSRGCNSLKPERWDKVGQKTSLYCLESVREFSL